MPIALQSRDALVAPLFVRAHQRRAPVRSGGELAGVRPVGAVPARQLRELLGGPRAVSAVCASGAALRDLHDQPLPAEAPRGGYGPPQEAAALAEAMERVIRNAPEMYATLGERARRVLEDLERLRTPKRRLIHGDLDDTRIRLTHDGDIVRIDADRPVAGDPVIDLANLIAHLEAAAEPVMASVLRDALLDGYGAPTRWKQRLEIYEESARLRLACARAVQSVPGVAAALALPI